ncbi:hypothetical protein THAOC_22060 [Thalassiosira oceanica]|uniref:Leucine-rich repeat domain-containing protein n=1 Tax=Thalassiosira oceanica TaxID=159749 RepID=K0SA81_THAOC|nr:hypothetical protein THAOC_22060 [Thalassiosira oceanica]|eukprot:EJK57856.1 hypothetical protein THAOC_22060 [Thalassiosira oceanica]
MAESFVLYEGEKIADELITRVRIGSEVTVIPDYAFLGYTNLTEVQLPEGLEVVGRGAFLNCKSLRSVTLPSTATVLGNGAFYGCINLVELQFDEGLNIIGKDAFCDCMTLQSVTTPSTVTELCRRAFRGCSGLTKLKLNDGLEIIGQEVFHNCAALRSVTIPSTVIEWGSGAFYGCSNLVELQLNEGLKIIGMAAFYFCSALRSVTLPSTVTKLCRGAFHDCSGLNELKLNEGLEIIGREAFRNCRALRSVTLPSTVNKLGEGAFQGCNNLSEVILLGGERFMNQDFLVHGLFNEEQGLLNQRSLYDFLVVRQVLGCYAFHNCPLNKVKVSMPKVLSERMERLPRECRRSIEERLQGLDRLEVTQDGNVLACFPTIDMINGYVHVRDTNLETARSVHRFLRWIAFHELKESTILIELAMWKSKIDDSVSELPREDCRVAIPGPAKTAIMEYCGFTGFLRPAIDVPHLVPNPLPKPDRPERRAGHHAGGAEPYARLGGDALPDPREGEQGAESAEQSRHALDEEGQDQVAVRVPGLVGRAERLPERAGEVAREVLRERRRRRPGRREGRVGLEGARLRQPVRVRGQRGRRPARRGGVHEHPGRDPPPRPGVSRATPPRRRRPVPLPPSLPPVLLGRGEHGRLPPPVHRVGHREHERHDVRARTGGADLVSPHPRAVAVLPLCSLVLVVPDAPPGVLDEYHVARVEPSRLVASTLGRASHDDLEWGQGHDIFGRRGAAGVARLVLESRLGSALRLVEVHPVHDDRVPLRVDAPRHVAEHAAHEGQALGRAAHGAALEVRQVGVGLVGEAGGRDEVRDARPDVRLDVRRDEEAGGGIGVGLEGSVGGRRPDVVAPAAFRGEAEGERREEDAGQPHPVYPSVGVNRPLWRSYGQSSQSFACLRRQVSKVVKGQTKSRFLPS